MTATEQGMWTLNGQPADDIPKLSKRPPATAVIAAARQINFKDRSEPDRYRRSIAPNTQRLWQTYDLIGEPGFAVDWAANVISKIRLLPVTWPDPERAPIPIPRDTPEGRAAWAPLERLKLPNGSHAPILRRMTQNWFTTGDGFLLGVNYGTRFENWSFRSTDEIQPGGRGFELVEDDETGKPRAITGKDVCVRMWIPHPRKFQVANPPLARALDSADLLLMLSQEIRSTLLQNLVNGLLGLPNDITFGSVEPTDDEDPEADPTISMFYNILEQARTNLGTARANAPVVMRGDGDEMQKIFYKTFARPLDERLPELIDLMIKRIAQSLPLPPEIITGSEGLSHWASFSVSRDAWVQHLEPFAIAEVDTFTTGWYWPMLGVQEINEDTPRLWFDPSNALLGSDKSKDIEAVYSLGEASGSALRRAKNLDESDKPTDEERLWRLISNKAAIDPLLAQVAIKKLLGIDLPQRDSVAVGRGAESTPRSKRVEHEGIPTETAPTTPSSRHTVPVGNVFPLADRLVGAADAACRRSLERAGSKVRTAAQKDRTLLNGIRPTPNSRVAAVLGAAAVEKLGFKEADLFDGSFPELKDQFMRWSQQLGYPAESIAASWASLSGSLRQICRRSLYETPDDFAPIVEPVVEEAIGHLLQPSVFATT